MIKIMNWSRYFSRAAALLLLLMSQGVALAQTSNEQEPRRLDVREHRSYTGLERIIPTHVKAQYAGGMGVASVGIGWDYGKKGEWETDAMLGYLPKRYSDAFHATFTLKQNYIPWSIRCHERFSVEPFTASIYFSLIAGEEYWMREPDRYGSSYYRFSTRMRINLGFGQRATWHLKNPQGSLRSITFYYEFHACDLDICAKFTNKELRIEDIAYFSCGLKFHLLRP